MPTIINYTGAVGKLPLVSTTPMVNFHWYAGFADTVVNLTFDTSSKFAAGVNNTSGKLPSVQQHWEKIMGTISDCLHLKANLKKKIIFKLTLLPKGVQTKYLKPL